MGVSACAWESPGCRSASRADGMPRDTLLIVRVSRARPRCLVVGGDSVWPLFGLLARAGFEVDVLPRASRHRLSRRVSRVIRVPEPQVADTAVALADRSSHDRYFIGDDVTLRELALHPSPIRRRLPLLPVISEAHVDHLASKIGLSRALRRGGILTPAFGVAQDSVGARQRAAEIGYPVMIKEDFGGGGRGVAAAMSPSEVDEILRRFAGPVLVQEWIGGTEVSIVAFYSRGELVHFAYQEPIVRQATIGPAVSTVFRATTDQGLGLIADVRRLGRVLGADGFVNVTAIEAAGQRYFIEADLRPNAWVRHGARVGDDPVIRLGRWLHGERTDHDRWQATGPGAASCRSTLLTRSDRRDLLTWRAGVWQDLFWDEPLLTATYAARALRRSAGPHRHRPEPPPSATGPESVVSAGQGGQR